MLNTIAFLFNNLTFFIFSFSSFSFRLHLLEPRVPGQRAPTALPPAQDQSFLRAALPLPAGPPELVRTDRWSVAASG